MITNKDLSIDSKNGQVTLNGDKYDLGTQGEIDAAVKDVYSVMGQMGAKNLIPYPYVNTSQTINNVEFTVNGDGSISVDNAASAITQFRLYGWTTGVSPFLLRKGTYILSGCPSGGGINSLRLYLHNQDSSITIPDDGEGTQFTLSDDTYVGIAIRVANGYDADGKTVYPMLRLASDTDDTYQPYAKTNKELTEAIGDLSGTGVTGDTIAAQIKALNDAIATVINA